MEIFWSCYSQCRAYKRNYDEAKVYGSAEIMDDALIKGKAEVYDNFLSAY